jgi:prepilin-type N-terminal cleavage/methylation domain-containing protein
MRIMTQRRAPRGAFTLIELLIVILIIGIMMTLFIAAGFKAFDIADQVKTRNDISQMDNALTAFKTKYGVGYIPSRLILCETFTDYSLTNPVDADSIAFIAKVWPRILATGGTDWAGHTVANPTFFIDWNGDGVNATGTANARVELEGDQVLVFLCGGIPDNISGTPGCLGFSTNPQNPAAAGGDRAGPFFDFKIDRLVKLPTVAPPTGAPPRSPLHYSYLDPYGTPYAFFSSYKASNGYNRYFNGTTATSLGDPSLLFSDCNTLGVWPYAQIYTAGTGGAPGAGRFLKPTEYQIISAGKNRLFGTGTVLSFTGGTTSGAPIWDATSNTNPDGSPGYDDLSNFHDKILGVPN